MKLKNCSYIAGSLLLVGAVLFSSGCGYKNKPVPPQAVAPRVIEDLRYTLSDKSVNLTWSYPVETMSGQDIEEIVSFELFRAEIPLADYCDSCPIPFDEPMILPGGVNPKEVRRTAEHESGLLRSGHKYFFKVRSRVSWWASSDDSNVVTFVYYTPAAAPQGLNAVYSENAIQLTWSPVTTLVDGKPVDLPLIYQVMRSLDDKEFSDLGAAQKETAFIDDTVETGKKYHYKVKSSMLFEDVVVEGSLSKSVAAAVKDTTPPPVVTGVTVVASAANVRVFWDAVDAPDLAGYRIYRRVEGGKAEVLGKVGPTQTIYIDKNPPGAVKTYYSVSAFDKEKPSNESKRSKEATTRH